MDHAEIRPTLDESVGEAIAFLEELRRAGVDYEDVVQTLEKEGVQKFADSFEELLEGIRNKSRQVVSQS